MPSFLRKIAPALLLILASSSAWAIGPKGDLYLGYSRLGSNAFYPNVGGLNGLEGAGHLKTGHFLGLEGDIAHYGYGAPSNDIKSTTYLFGPRVTVGALGVKVFAHALVGGGHSTSTGGINLDATNLAYALGGGADFPILHFFAWRVNGDYIAAPTVTTQNATKARISTGLVFRF